MNIRYYVVYKNYLNDPWEYDLSYNSYEEAEDRLNRIFDGRMYFKIEKVYQ